MSLSEHAAALAAILDDTDSEHVAAMPLPFGIPAAERAALLDSVGLAVSELRAAGRDLAVTTKRIDNGELFVVEDRAAPRPPVPQSSVGRSAGTPVPKEDTAP